MASIDRALSAISAAHLDAGHPDPTRHSGVVRVRAGLRRSVGVAPKRLAYPLSTEEIRRIIDAIPDDLRGVRDRALILTGFAGALRRSEVVALAVGDVTFRPKGAVLIIRSSKTDQEGVGQIIGIARGRRRSTDPVAALRRWLEVAHLQDGNAPLFGPIAWSGVRSRSNALSGRDVARILQSRAAAAGLGDLPISGHSLRAGHATEAASRGVPADRLARTTRHKSAAALARYVRPAEVLSDTSSSDLGL
jgi:integrase